MSISIDAAAFQEITATMRQLKSLLDAKLQERLSLEKCYKEKLHTLTLQLNLSNTRLQCLQASRTTEEQRHQSDISLLTSQIEYLKKEICLLKSPECDLSSRTQHHLECQLDNLQKANTQLAAEVERWREVQRITQKEVAVVLQLQGSRQGLKVDHERWLTGAYRMLEENYRNLQVKYGALQRQQGCDLCQDPFVEAVAVDEKVIGEKPPEEPPKDGEPPGNVESPGEPPKDDKSPEEPSQRRSNTSKKSVKINDGKEAIEAKKSVKADDNAPSPEITPEVAAKDKIIETLEQERRASIKQMDALNNTLQEQKQELTELKKDRRRSSAASIAAQETLVKSTEAQKESVQNRVKSLSQSLSVMQSGTVENSRLKDENSLLKQELRKSLDLVDKQAFLLKKEKKSFFDETDSTASIEERPPESGASTPVSDASSHEFEVVPSSTAELQSTLPSAIDASSTEMPPTKKKSTKPDVVVTAPSGEDTGAVAPEKRKSSGVHLEPPRKSVILQRKSSEGSRAAN